MLVSVLNYGFIRVRMGMLNKTYIMEYFDKAEHDYVKGGTFTNEQAAIAFAKWFNKTHKIGDFNILDQA